MRKQVHQSEKDHATISRRGVITAIGALGLAAAATTTASAEEKEKIERTFEGEAKNGKLQEALDQALQQLDRALGDGGVADGLATWKIAEVTGQRGGFAGFHTVKVKIRATRSPAWPKK